VLLILLTTVTGVVDAVSYIALGHVFVANMTGNVVFLGFALAGAPGLSAPHRSRRWAHSSSAPSPVGGSQAGTARTAAGSCARRRLSRSSPPCSPRSSRRLPGNPSPGAPATR
jgi:hypothetical protein